MPTTLTVDRLRDATLLAGDAPQRWVVRVDERLTVAPEGTPPPADVVTFTGTAAALHLALWNRGDEISAAGPPSALLDRWRSTQRIRWS